MKAIADTHAVIWYLSKDPRLSAAAKDAIDQATDQGDTIGISTISFVEMVYLIEKQRIPAVSLPDLMQRLDEPDPIFIEVPVARHIIDAMATIPRGAVPDMPDRIIAATALRLGIPVISRDGKIQLSQVPTIW